MNKEWNWKWDSGQGDEAKWNGNAHDKKKYRFTKLFWGLLLILMGVFLVISQLGLITGISIWSVFFTVIFASLLIRGLIKRNFSSIFFAIAFLCIIYDDQLGITALTPWTVLLAALLLSIGMEILFHQKRHYRNYIRFGDDNAVDGEGGDHTDNGIHLNINIDRDDDDGEEFDKTREDHKGTAQHEQSMQGAKIYQSNHFSTCSKYINPENFEQGMLENSFGNMNVFFENVPTRKKEGFLSVENSFGEMNIYVPSSWLVDMTIEDHFGSGSSMKGNSDGNGDYLLHIKGENSFGVLHVIYQ